MEIMFELRGGPFDGGFLYFETDKEPHELTEIDPILRSDTGHNYRIEDFNPYFKLNRAAYIEPNDLRQLPPC